MIQHTYFVHTALPIILVNFATISAPQLQDYTSYLFATLRKHKIQARFQTPKALIESNIHDFKDWKIHDICNNIY